VTAGKYGGHPPGLASHGDVAHGVDASEEGHEAARSDRAADESGVELGL
jgi:hypothetical protein